MIGLLQDKNETNEYFEYYGLQRAIGAISGYSGPMRQFEQVEKGVNVIALSKDAHGALRVRSTRSIWALACAVLARECKRSDTIITSKLVPKLAAKRCQTHKKIQKGRKSSHQTTGWSH